MPGSTASGIVYPVVTDDVDVSGDMLAMANSLETLTATPLCKLILATNFGVGNNSNTIAVPFGSGSENIKTHSSMHSTTTNTTRIIPPIPGYYRLTGNSVLAPNGTGFRTHAIGKNGVRQVPEQGIYVSASLPTGANAPLPMVTTVMSANGTTDYFELFIFQNSGGTLNAIGDGSTTTTANTMFMCEYVRPL